MPPKKKGHEEPVHPGLHLPVDLDHILLVDNDYKIHETLCEFELFEMHYWLEDKFIDNSDDIRLWESNFPHYIFPHTHNAPTGDILCNIASQSIKKMMQAPIIENATPFS